MINIEDQNILALDLLASKVFLSKNYLLAICVLNKY